MMPKLALGVVEPNEPPVRYKNPNPGALGPLDPITSDVRVSCVLNVNWNANQQIVQIYTSITNYIYSTTNVPKSTFHKDSVKMSW